MISLAQITHTLEQLKTDKERAAALNKHAWEIRRSEPHTSLHLAHLARELANQLKDKEELAYSYRNSGTAYYLLSVYESALTDLNKALTLFKETQNKHQEATIIRNIGNIYHSIDEDEKSLNYYLQAIQITQTLHDKQGTAYNYGNIGYVYSKMKKYDLALENMFKTLEICEEICDDLGIADVCSNIGKTYLYLEKRDEAKKYLNKSLQHSHKINHLRGIAWANGNLGNLYLKNKDFPKAISFQQQALDAASQMGEKLLVAEVLRNFADTYEQAHDYQKALDYYKEYEKTEKEILKTNTTAKLETIKTQFDLEQAEKEKLIYQLKNIELENAYNEIKEKNNELERLSLVASQTENIILILEPDGEVVWINDSFVRLNKLTLEELKAERGNTIFTISNNPNIRAIVEESISSKKAVQYESLNITKEGGKVWESSTLTPIFDPTGNLKKLIIIDQDVTARKEAEEIISQKNKEITDSINYAKRIQEAIFPAKESKYRLFPNAFVYYQPRDVVSGDFYWFAEKNGKKVIAATDCTGHGVPGAFMSMIGIDQLNQLIIEQGIIQPAEVLNQLNKNIKKALKQTEDTETKDGMDIALCALDEQRMLLDYAGAHRPLYLIRQGELKEIKANRMAIGGFTMENYQFYNHELPLQKGDTFYIFSDGYIDQFGGNEGRKFMSKQFKLILLSIQDKTMFQQEEILHKTIHSWKGKLSQTDDILVIGVRV